MHNLSIQCAFTGFKKYTSGKKKTLVRETTCISRFFGASSHVLHGVKRHVWVFNQSEMDQ